MQLPGNVVAEDSVEHEKVPPTMRMAKGGSVTLVGLLLSKVLIFSTEIFLARFLGASAYGLYSLARTIVRIPNFATDLGLPQGVVRFGSIYRNNNDLGKLKGLLISSLQIVALVGFIVSILLFISAQTIAGWFSDPALAAPIKILAWILAPSGIVAVTAAFFRSQLRFKPNVGIEIVYQPVITFVLSLVFVAYLGYGLEGAAFAFLITVLTNALIGLFVTRRSYLPILSTSHASYNLRKWLRFSIPTFSLGVSVLLMRYTGRLLLGYFGEPAAVGVFSAAGAIADNLTLFLLAFNPIFAPLVSRFYQQKDHKGLARNFKNVSRWQLMLTLPFALIMLLYPSELMSLFGTDFQAAGNVLIILALAQLVNVGTGPVGMVLLMTDHQDIEMGNGIAAFLINLLLGVWLIPQYEALGAALATALALSLFNLIRLLEVYLLLGMQPFYKPTIKCLIAAVISFLCVSWFNKIITINNVIFELMIGTILIFFIYLVALIGLKIEKDDKDFGREMKKTYMSKLKN